MERIIVMILAIAGWEVGKWLFDKLWLPYRWYCPGCTFKVRSSSRSAIERIKTTHQHDA